MNKKKISQLIRAVLTNKTNSTLIPVSQDGESKSVSVQQILDAVPVDQTYSGTSTHAISGAAAKQAIDNSVGDINAALGVLLDGSTAINAGILNRLTGFAQTELVTVVENLIDTKLSGSLVQQAIDTRLQTYMSGDEFEQTVENKLNSTIGPLVSEAIDEQLEGLDDDIEQEVSSQLGASLVNVRAKSSIKVYEQPGSINLLPNTIYGVISEHLTASFDVFEQEDEAEKHMRGKLMFLVVGNYGDDTTLTEQLLGLAGSYGSAVFERGTYIVKNSSCQGTLSWTNTYEYQSVVPGTEGNETPTYETLTGTEKVTVLTISLSNMGGGN